jgi:hypothetical protein
LTTIPHTSGDAASWQAGFLSILPAVETHAKIRFRKLPAERRQDAIQEAIASACVSYQLLAARGRLQEAHPGTVADFAVKFVRNGRHVGGKQDAAKDTLSPVARSRHHFGTIGIDRYDGKTDEWRQVVIAERKASIPDTAAFRIDFAQWLKLLSHRDRRIVAALARGEQTSAVADRFGLTPGRVSQLRRKYQHLWLAFQGESDRGAA